MTVDVASVSAGSIRFGVVSGMTHDIGHSPHEISGTGVPQLCSLLEQTQQKFLLILELMEVL